MARRPAKTDPLSSVRISDPKGDDPIVETAEIVPPPRKSRPRGKREAPPKLPPVEPAIDAPRYKVLAMKKLSLRGQMVTFKLGKVVSESTHGPGIIKMLEKAGVPLEQIE
jgi:hypothetical protein